LSEFKARFGLLSQVQGNWIFPPKKKKNNCKFVIDHGTKCIAKNVLSETVLFGHKPNSASYAWKSIIKWREVIRRAVWFVWRIGDCNSIQVWTLGDSGTMAPSEA